MAAAELHLEQTYEKQLPAEVSQMVWSPKMDLIAFALASGGVALYRMTLHRVWSVEPPEEGVTVTALCWRPDGRLLAVAYTSGLVSHLDLESGETVFSETYPSTPTCLTWAQVKPEENTAPVQNTVPETVDTAGDEITAAAAAAGTEAVDDDDDDDEFLPPLPSLSKHYGSVNRHSEEDPQDIQGISSLTSLTVLAVGTSDGSVSLLLHGMLLFGRFTCESCLQPRAVHFAPDLSRALLLCQSRTKPCTAEQGGEQPHTQSKQNELSEGGMIQFELDTSVLSQSAEELRQLTAAYGRLSSHLVYLDRTIQAICESWESVLMEMDTKMERFQASLAEDTSLAVEFLELLMFGVPSPEMEHFLLNDLTDKGLKKLRHSIELSYTNIQTLVLRHLQAVGLQLADRLAAVAGMARHTQRYGQLGLSEPRAAAAQHAAALFLVKATELQQVIDNSTRTFKAFFRWLYVVILRLSEESLPQECVKLSQKDLQFIAEFIDTNLGSSATQDGVHLERVGMYLRNEQLPAPAAGGGAQERNPWLQFLLSSPGLMAAAPDLLVVPSNGRRSLLQERDALRRAVTELFADTCRAGSETLSVVSDSRRCLSERACPLTAISCAQPAGFFSVAVPEDQPDCVRLLYGGDQPRQLRLDALLPGQPRLQVRQLAVYSGAVLSLLATEAGLWSGPLYLQLDLATATQPGCCAVRRLENIAPAGLAVSGARSLVAVLFRGGRRARIYDTAESELEESVLEESHDSTAELMDDDKENHA